MVRVAQDCTDCSMMRAPKWQCNHLRVAHSSLPPTQPVVRFHLADLQVKTTQKSAPERTKCREPSAEQMIRANLCVVDLIRSNTSTSMGEILDGTEVALRKDQKTNDLVRSSYRMHVQLPDTFKAFHRDRDITITDIQAPPTPRRQEA